MIEYSKIIEEEINKYLCFFKPNIEAQLFDCIQYALNSGGKRIRPTLMLLSAKMLNVPAENALPFAIALECIHTYSLIHDDLPAMDNDDFRRGQPTAHKKYGEATAILAGDALLNMAYEIMLKEAHKGIGYIAATRIMAISAGGVGMVNGQAKEIALCNMQKSEIREEDILGMYSDKTGALIRAAIMVPYYLTDEDKFEESDLLTLANNIGIIFQLVDDILDTASGVDVGKLTFVNLFGDKRAHQCIEFANDTCKTICKKIGDSSTELAKYAAKLVQRKN